MEDVPPFPLLLLPPTSWLHCIACDCLSEVAGSFVDDAGLTRCPVCGTPILEGWDDGD